MLFVGQYSISIDPVSYKIISYVYVSGSLGARLLSVVLKEDGRLIILEQIVESMLYP